LLFGGGAGVQLNDTWTWDGRKWRQENPATSPPPRIYASMAYADASDSVVLFGGMNVSELGDTWIWNRTTWVQQHPGTSPTGGGYKSMAYDSAKGVLVLYTSPGTKITGFSSETWAWDGHDWKRLL